MLPSTNPPTTLPLLLPESNKTIENAHDNFINTTVVLPLHHYPLIPSTPIQDQHRQATSLQLIFFRTNNRTCSNFFSTTTMKRHYGTGQYGIQSDFLFFKAPTNHQPFACIFLDPATALPIRNRSHKPFDFLYFSKVPTHTISPLFYFFSDKPRIFPTTNPPWSLTSATPTTRTFFFLKQQHPISPSFYFFVEQTMDS